MEKKVLLISPHPDDLELGLGMKIRCLANQGYSIHALTLCKGELGGDPDIRKNESNKAAKILGIEKNILLAFKNTEFHNNERQINEALTEYVNSFQPDIVFLPDERDNMEDHVICSKVGYVATRGVPNLIHYYCETSQVFDPNAFFVGNEELMQIKIRAISCHESQVSRGGISPDKALLEGRFWYGRCGHHSLKKRIEGIKGQSQQFYAEPFKIIRQVEF